MINFRKKVLKYFYNPTSGEFLGSGDNISELWKDIPYIEREQFYYADYRVNVETRELVYTPHARNTITR